MFQRAAERLMREGRQGPSPVSPLDKCCGLGHTVSTSAYVSRGLLGAGGQVPVYLRAPGGQGCAYYSLCAHQRGARQTTDFKSESLPRSAQKDCVQVSHRVGMRSPKATSQSFLPGSWHTGCEHGACSCPCNVSVVRCYWNRLWLSLRAPALSPPPARWAVCMGRWFVLPGWMHREPLCFPEHLLHAVGFLWVLFCSAHGSPGAPSPSERRMGFVTPAREVHREGEVMASGGCLS